MRLEMGGNRDMPGELWGLTMMAMVVDEDVCREIYAKSRLYR